MNEIAHDLLLLMAELAKLEDHDDILAANTDTVNNLRPGCSIAYQHEAPAHGIACNEK